ncbi:hypothetical protein HUG15_04880 [Salicibibacter cibarius]|uniref:MaoC-like domain-containing protein n=1 Tax=Salicibibacter cibarius TaxID=2743000 RepID=A0A7T6Z104_9BACI|nr:MaoC/PaaZ C-terminal domain-containing protein [Salicibibacter cibarius]QQK75000.1 hypothetical protein HUG15_04880 [Salicibibacter cibarius]
MKYEQMEINNIYKTATYTVTKEEIYNFALKFDPQYMHTDDEKANKSIFGGVIASGLHTLSISWKLWVDMNLIGEDIIGGVRMDHEFLKPVYPGDILTVEARIIDKQDHNYKKDRGYISILLNTYNQDKKIVMNLNFLGLIKRGY